MSNNTYIVGELLDPKRQVPPISKEKLETAILAARKYPTEDDIHQKQYTTMKNKYQAFLQDTLTSLRSKRDAQFAQYNIDKDSTYQNGDFTSLPSDLLMTICYIDAYASALANFKEIFEID